MKTRKGTLIILLNVIIGYKICDVNGEIGEKGKKFAEKCGNLKN